MIGLACAGVLFLANHRVDDRGVSSVLTPDWEHARQAALARTLAEPEAVLALSLPSTLGAHAAAKDGSYDIVVAAIRPERALIDAFALLNAETGDASTDGGEFAGPPEPGPRPSKSIALAAVASCAVADDGAVCDETGDDAIAAAESPAPHSMLDRREADRRDWSDGLPVGPRIPARVAYADYDGDAFVGPEAPLRPVPVVEQSDADTSTDTETPAATDADATIENEARSESDAEVKVAERRDYDGDAFVGPIAPVTLIRVADEADAETSDDVKTAVLRDWDGDAFVGPMLPGEVAGDTQIAGHRPHGLPFKPLNEPAFRATREQAGASTPADLAAILAEAEEYHTVRYVHEVAHKVASGETLSEVLAKVGGLGGREVEQWLSAAKEHYNPNKVYAGQVVSLLLDMPEGRARRMKLESSRDSIVVVEAKAGKVTSRKEEIPYEKSVNVVSGTIEQSLYVDAVEHGLPEKVIAEIAEILGWDINFGRDLRAGATYRVAYEQLTRMDTMASRAGRVLAVEVENRDKKYEGFYFASADGKNGGYYNRNGEGLGRAFLRYPVSFNRISSHFSTKRFHPVLKRNVPHYGVDFAAPTGTPVKAVAAGVISKAGWHGGNGRFVKMRHDSVYESGYAHLSKIASGIKPGAHVKQGQIIGYVGSTGLATGPHLHYAMYRSGKYIDPLRAGLPRRRSLEGTELARFKAQRDKIDAIYAEHSQDPIELAKAAVEDPETAEVEQD
jgi:murein DD-endopeptidase MepM/ murein hydrolase activator NlpD